MRRFILLAAVGVALLGGVETASAQQGARAPNYGPGYRPQLSPYLDLADFGNGINGGMNFNPAIRYYNGTLTEFNRRENDSTFRSTFQEIERELYRSPTTARDDALLAPLSQTGHLTAFGNTGTFFGDPFRTTGGLTSRGR